jgi:hypothetical protein
MSNRLILEPEISLWFRETMEALDSRYTQDEVHDFKTDLLDRLVAGVPFDFALQEAADNLGFYEESEVSCVSVI